MRRELILKVSPSHNECFLPHLAFCLLFFLSLVFAAAVFQFTRYKLWEARLCWEFIVGCGYVTPCVHRRVCCVLLVSNQGTTNSTQQGFEGDSDNIRPWTLPASHSSFFSLCLVFSPTFSSFIFYAGSSIQSIPVSAPIRNPYKQRVRNQRVGTPRELLACALHIASQLVC